MNNFTKGIVATIAIVSTGFVVYFAATNSFPPLTKSTNETTTLPSESVIATTTPLTTNIPSATPLPTTPSITVSVTSTPLPTSDVTQLTAKITANHGTPPYYKFTFDAPTGVKISSDMRNIYLLDGTKTFMWFYVPYEYYAKYSYTSITNISSDTLLGLRRFTSKLTMGNDFKVGYTTQIYTAAMCAEDVAFEAVEAPCTAPISTYGSDVGFAAFCSVNAKYTPMCDRVMKNIKIQKL